MLILIPEIVNFIISTTDILVKYNERNETYVEFDALSIENYVNREEYTAIQVLFDTVAELKCCSLNFHETFHKGYEIFDVSEGGSDLEFWKENGYHPDSGFYQVDKSDWLKESNSKYDPRGRLNLKHFLVVGNDSYIELLAKGYTIR